MPDIQLFIEGPKSFNNPFHAQIFVLLSEEYDDKQRWNCDQKCESEAWRWLHSKSCWAKIKWLKGYGAAQSQDRVTFYYTNY